MLDWIKSLTPYQSLALLLVPIVIIEPLKLAAVFVAGDGHWFTGIVVEIAAYAASLLLVHKLFVIVEPKLMEMRWFARCCEWLMKFRDRVFGSKADPSSS